MILGCNTIHCVVEVRLRRNWAMCPLSQLRKIKLLWNICCRLLFNVACDTEVRQFLSQASLKRYFCAVLKGTTALFSVPNYSYVVSCIQWLYQLVVRNAYQRKSLSHSRIHHAFAWKHSPHLIQVSLPSSKQPSERLGWRSLGPLGYTPPVCVTCVLTFWSHLLKATLCCRQAPIDCIDLFPALIAKAQKRIWLSACVEMQTISLWNHQGMSTLTQRYVPPHLH